MQIKDMSMMPVKTGDSRGRRTEHWVGLGMALVALSLAAGCGTSKAGKQNQPFFTSGSREADQRASQRMAKAEQLNGSGEGAGETDVKKGSGSGSGAQRLEAEKKLSLYDRLGGERGIAALVEDFTPRLLQDPRVNWDRKGLKKGGLFHHGPSVTWNPTPQNVATLKKHMVQLIALATGGPSQYQGREIKPVHDGMQISNPEFDAAIGDIKASLDKLRVPNNEQKELLAIFESARPEIVTER